MRSWWQREPVDRRACWHQPPSNSTLDPHLRAAQIAPSPLGSSSPPSNEPSEKQGAFRPLVDAQGETTLDQPDWDGLVIDLSALWRQSPLS